MFFWAGGIAIQSTTILDFSLTPEAIIAYIVGHTWGRPSRQLCQLTLTLT